jgi:hypothetical protein
MSNIEFLAILLVSVVNAFMVGLELGRKIGESKFENKLWSIDFKLSEIQRKMEEEDETDE